MKKYLIVVEKTGTGYSAYSPDLDGCVATGKTREEVEREMQEAIAFHLDGMTRRGEASPEPHSYSAYVEVRAQARKSPFVAVNRIDSPNPTRHRRLRHRPAS